MAGFRHCPLLGLFPKGRRAFRVCPAPNAPFKLSQDHQPGAAWICCARRHKITWVFGHRKLGTSVRHLTKRVEAWAENPEVLFLLRCCPSWSEGRIENPTPSSGRRPYEARWPSIQFGRCPKDGTREPPLVIARLNETTLLSPFWFSIILSPFHQRQLSLLPGHQ